MCIKFGPAGTNAAFISNVSNNLLEYPKYLSLHSLNAYEYQCGHGVRISQTRAEDFGAECAKNNICLSIHSPYYISLSSTDPDKRNNSIKYILQTAKIAKSMGASRIVVHSGSCSKISRTSALELASHTLQCAMDQLKDNGLQDIIICPEVMGKINQLGTLEEVIDLCKLNENLIPCVDFGHFNCRTFGSLKDICDYEKILTSIEDHLGIYRLKNLHIHFSKIEYSIPGGEKRHLTFEDNFYGPSFEPLADLLVKKNCSPVVICESAGTQVEDALYMKMVYNDFKKLY